jgi:hypothetical protein
MLRRPPTRIPLKTDDIEEYDEMLRERKMEQKETSKSEDSFASPRTTIKRKKSAAERIGLKGKH